MMRVKIISMLGLILLSGCNAKLQLPPEIAAGGVTTTQTCSATAIAQLPFAGGKGTSAAPYLICSPNQLRALAGGSTYFGAYFSLEADIDLGGAAFPSIGNFDRTSQTGTPFAGFFEGNNHKISNLNITSTATSTGLFGGTVGATVQNLTIDSATIQGNGQTGILIGYAIRTAVNNVQVRGTVTDSVGTYNTGGLIGRVDGLTAADTSVVQNSSANVTMTADDSVGGLIGEMHFTSVGSMTVTNCRSSGSIVPVAGSTGNTYAGLLGYIIFDASRLTISQSSSTASVLTNGAFSGGFGGTLNIANGSVVSIDRSFYNGAVTSAATFGWFCGASIGGFLGSTTAIDSSLTITNSHASGSVSNTGTGQCGGSGTSLAGFLGLISAQNAGSISVANCFSTSSLVVASASSVALAGFAGSARTSGAATLSMANVYVSATVNLAANNDQVGGLIGSMTGSPSIDRAYSSVTFNTGGGNTNFGAFIGAAFGTISNSYFNSDLMATAIGSANGAGAPAAETALQLKQQGTFAVWDFTNVWTIVNGTSFPTLR